MEMNVEGNDDEQINAGADREARADRVPNEVVTGVDERAHEGQHRSDEALAIAQRMLKEKIVKYLADVEANKARISHLESMLMEFGIRPDGSSSNAPLLEAKNIDRAPPMVHASVQVERDAIVEQTTVANLHALELSTVNQELQRQLEVLRPNPFEAENQAL